MKIVGSGGHLLSISNVRMSDDFDVASFECGEPEFSGLLNEKEKYDVVDSAYLTIGSEVTLAGFPNWQKGDTPHVEKGFVTAFTKYGEAKMIRISPKIIFGNSGGPILDKKGRVVGIATVGASVMDDSTHSYLCIPSADLLKFLS
jgi:V8-like Glu-specific endopeptidase